MTTNKKQNALENAIGRGELSDSFAENPLVQWISDNGRNILWLLLAMIALILLGYRLMGGGPGGGSAKDYLIAEREMQLFLKVEDTETGKANLAKLSQILKRHPELQPKYDGQIAQALFIRGEAAAALPFAERTLARLSEEKMPLYHDYSATTLLIENQKYKEALEQALALRTKMDAQLNAGTSGLYAVNLLRIATLDQLLGLKSEELKSLAQLKVYLKEQGQIQGQILESLREGKVSLLDYIAFREKELKN